LCIYLQYKMTIYSKNQYFEAKLQLRPFNREVYEFVKKEIDKKDSVFIAKEVKLKEGIDIYLSSQKFARSLGLKIKKNFKGELKTSRSLFTVNKMTSKRVYRVTVLFRLKQ